MRNFRGWGQDPTFWSGRTEPPLYKYTKSDIFAWPLTFQTKVTPLKLNHHAKYLGQRSFSSNVIVQTLRHTHIQDGLLYLHH